MIHCYNFVCSARKCPCSTFLYSSVTKETNQFISLNLKCEQNFLRICSILLLTELLLLTSILRYQNIIFVHGSAIFKHLLKRSPSAPSGPTRVSAVASPRTQTRYSSVQQLFEGPSPKCWPHNPRPFFKSREKAGVNRKFWNKIL
jgi:hypothetical protein